MKVLINCYACSPYQGSEPGMGWNFVKCLSRLHELHVITESKFQPDLDKYFSEHPDEKQFFNFYFIRKSRHKKLRKIWPPSYYWFYKAWQKKAYQLALHIDEKENFDLIHQLNMVGYREPGYLWKIDKPFVWGPIGGFGITPWRMLPSMGLHGMIYYGGRNIVNKMQMHLSLRVRNAMRHSDELIAATADIQKTIKTLYQRESVIIPEVGLEVFSNSKYACRDDDENLRICWSGQHTPGKALFLLLYALASISREDIELHIIGKGSETRKWKELAGKLNLHHLFWHGWLTKEEAHNIMRKSHLLCITSLKDLTSTVLLEGLSFGLPVIALDHCGFSNVINSSCGMKIAINKKEQIVSDIAEAILELANNESLRRELADGALKRAKEYNWEDKASAICKIYESVSV